MSEVELTYFLEEEGDGRLIVTVPEKYEDWIREFMESSNLVFDYKSWRD